MRKHLYSLMISFVPDNVYDTKKNILMKKVQFC